VWTVVFSKESSFCSIFSSLRAEGVEGVANNYLSLGTCTRKGSGVVPICSALGWPVGWKEVRRYITEKKKDS